MPSAKTKKAPQTITLNARNVKIFSILLAFSYIIVLFIYKKFFTVDTTKWVLDTRLTVNKMTHDFTKKSDPSIRNILTKAGITLDDENHLISNKYDYEETFTVCIEQFDGLMTMTYCDPSYKFDKRTNRLLEAHGCLVNFSNTKNLPQPEDVRFDAEESVKKVFSTMKANFGPSVESVTRVSANLKYYIYRNYDENKTRDKYITCDYDKIVLAWVIDISDSSPGGYSAAVDAVSGEVLYSGPNGDF